MTRPFATLVIAAVLASGAAARANVWEDAIGIGSPDASRDRYESELRQGDEHTMQANARGISYRELKNQVGLALASYRAAAAARPSEGEPYFRIARVLYSFYFECQDVSRGNSSLLCDPRTFPRAKAEEVIEAWDAFEARAPLDPRMSVGAFGDNEILFRRAILHTKLGTRPHLEAAARDYEKILARQDATDSISEHVVGNLAETYMMVGRLEEAIEMYKQALRGAADASTWYGYAVALDRDERTAQAVDIIQGLGRDQRDLFHTRVAKGDTFFVPEGEKYYYFALVDEALGLDEDAIASWRMFIRSGAHPQYQPRAKAHLDGLLARQRKKPPLPTDRLFGRPWRGVLP